MAGTASEHHRTSGNPHNSSGAIREVYASGRARAVLRSQGSQAAQAQRTSPVRAAPRISPLSDAMVSVVPKTAAEKKCGSCKRRKHANLISLDFLTTNKEIDRASTGAHWCRSGCINCGKVRQMNHSVTGTKQKSGTGAYVETEEPRIENGLERVRGTYGWAVICP